MGIEELDCELPDNPLPESVTSLIQSADRRWHEFFAKQLNKRYPRYIASEPAQVFAALKHVRDSGLCMGDRFIEWGSGFGLATGMAALLGFDALGIELEGGLVEIARALSSEQGIDCRFLATSYIPEGYLSYESVGGTDLVPDDSFGHSIPAPRYEGLDHSLAEVDLFFVYPWPGEQEMMLKLFDAVAGPDAVLIAYYGDREICLYRKT